MPLFGLVADLGLQGLGISLPFEPHIIRRKDEKATLQTSSGIP